MEHETVLSYFYDTELIKLGRVTGYPYVQSYLFLYINNIMEMSYPYNVMIYVCILIVLICTCTSTVQHKSHVLSKVMGYFTYICMI